ncbi:hypothetical protein YB2330_005197 [Saitoella coloradoensis]
MKMHASILVAALAASGHAAASCLHGTQFYKRQAESATVSTAEATENAVEPEEERKIQFSYTGETGPLNWHNLAAANSKCNTGLNQSPISLDYTVSNISGSAIQMNVPTVPVAHLENLGTTLEVAVNGTTIYDNKTYSLAQFHFHTPSEHRFADEYMPLEMHMVHQADDGSLLVVGPSFQLDEEGGDEFLDAVVHDISAVQHKGNETETEELDFSKIIELVTGSEAQNFVYSGSLTTPPCAEGVTFIIPHKQLSLSIKQYNAMKSIIKFNSRYTQNAPGKANLLQVASVDESASEEINLTIPKAFAESIPKGQCLVKVLGTCVVGAF